MKKILCFILSFMLLFNTTVVYADISGTLPTPLPTPPPLPPDPAEFLIRLCLPDGGEAIDYISDWLEKRWSTDEDKSKDMSSDGNTVTFNSNFVNEFNTALQDKVHALDGFYLVEPSNQYSLSYYRVYENWDESFYSTSLELNSSSSLYFKCSSFYNYILFLPSDTLLYLRNGYVVTGYDLNKNVISGYPFKYVSENSKGKVSIETCGNSVGASKYNDFLKFLNNDLIKNGYGKPFKIFYSKDTLSSYVANGQQRTYVPQLPSGGFKVNIKYISNTTNLPDITYNITTENKTETEIQNQYDTTINNYLNGLDDFTDGGGGNNPTPTPSGGGSGGFGDGSTPTPTPPLGDGGSDQDGGGSDGWLKKIYDQLVKLSDSVSQHFEKEEAFEDKLSKYLESHDKKLDAIVDAIDKLSQGKEEGEEKGCKYDYTKLSDFMTKLWNDSDQKFDQMVELLKENNEYQEKMLSTLNSIKNILLAQTVMDAFKNRSSETANKAKEKFPTSVPWDIALIVNAMDAEPKAPVFELPVKIERLNIDEKITVDISSGEWEKLAKACRYMLSLLFVLFMVNLTRKLFFSKGDD